jgi:hypothetical protein
LVADREQKRNSKKVFWMKRMANSLTDDQYNVALEIDLVTLEKVFTMELLKLLRTFNSADNIELKEILQQEWEISVQSEPANWNLLDSKCWRENFAWSGCEQRCDAALEEAVAIIAARQELHLLAWHCHRLIFDVDNFDTSKLAALIPLLDNIKPDFNAVFFLWLTLGTVPRLRGRNELRGIPDEITKATLWDIAIAQRRYARYHDNKIGMQPRLFSWHRLITSGNLHRVGRFEYIARPFRGRLRAFRNTQNHDVIALSTPEIKYNAEGYFPLNGEEPSWSSDFVTTESTFKGSPVSPRGFACSHTLEINHGEWREVLAPEDTVLEIHIPEGEALSEDACRQSFADAISFFAKFYPEVKARSFVCYSWLFNTQFETLFAPNSNIVGWQREVYEFPMPSTGGDGLYFIFGQDKIDPSTAPRDSQLRRAILEHLEAGNTLRSGGMFFLFDDLEKYGTQCYRAMEKNWKF